MQIDLCDAKERLSELAEAASRGEIVIIARAGRALAKLGPVEKETRPVRFGLMKGMIRIGHDFDAPLTESVLREFKECDQK